MKRLVTVLALLCSIASLLVVAGGGLALLAIEVSGERGAGALMALGSGLASAAVVALVFAPEGFFSEGIRKGGAIAAAIVGAMPVAGLAYLAIRFAGIPLGSRVPLLDWTVLFVGIVFGLGALSILALGHRRSQDSVASGEAAAPVVHMQQIRHAQQQLRSAFAVDDRGPVASDEDDDIRVRRV